jgi:hypothetical protein
MNRSRPAASRLLLVLRVLGAGSLAATAGIHLYLWNSGYSDIDSIGPLFLVNVVAGLVFCLAVLLAPRRWLAAVAALGAMLQAGTLGGLILSMWIGFFGFVESTKATLFWPSVWVEAAGVVVLGALAALTFLGDRASGHVPTITDRIRSGR